MTEAQLCLAEYTKVKVALFLLVLLDNVCSVATALLLFLAEHS
jgi:hypothetical protein